MDQPEKVQFVDGLLKEAMEDLVLKDALIEQREE
jgi:hypothetical protein